MWPNWSSWNHLYPCLIYRTGWRPSKGPLSGDLSSLSQYHPPSSPFSSCWFPCFPSLVIPISSTAGPLHRWFCCLECSFSKGFLLCQVSVQTSLPQDSFSDPSTAFSQVPFLPCPCRNCNPTCIPVFWLSASPTTLCMPQGHRQGLVLLTVPHLQSR